VVGADQQALGGALTLDDAVGAVAAHIVEAAHDPILGPDQKHRLVGDLPGQVGTRHGQVAVVAEPGPAAVEDRRVLGAIGLGRGVEAVLQRRLQRRALGGVAVHGRFSLYPTQRSMIAGPGLSGFRRILSQTTKIAPVGMPRISGGGATR
jgi:hypothetical protein